MLNGLLVAMDNNVALDVEFFFLFANKVKR